MNQEIRNRLRNVVTQCRKLLEDSVTQDLEGKFGIFARNGQVTADPNAPMTHLSDEEQAARKDILDHFEHVKARGFKPKDALDQLIREIAFTHLNRFCAYKMMEAREVYIGGQKFREAVSRGFNSNGVKFYLADHSEDERLFNTGQQDIAYRHFLNWLGGQLSEEIGVLFSPNDPANRLYPRQSTLDQVLNLLNKGGIRPEETELREAWPSIWSSDETIGWVYQYFTPKELRDHARKESQAPRNSYELAFRNQFFTPRYVVEFLTDNTLGRIWFEMRKGNTKLAEQCRYLILHPTEIFQEKGEQPRSKSAEREDLSQGDSLRLPVYVPHRQKKDPRQLRILDPASGSGHFLLYCFDLLQTIYEEAYSDEDLGSTFREQYHTIEDLRRDIPRLILAHNLHGVDIDLRASQIAALALWLRCQRAYQDIGLKGDRLKITRSNFVCAEPMPGEEQMLKDFVDQLEPKVLGQVVEVIFYKMKLAGEAGALLKIEEEIRDTVSAAKKQWLRETTRATDRKGEPLLFVQAVMDKVAGKADQSSLFDLSGITDDQFFEQAEAKVVEVLRKYAEIAKNGDRLQRKLFAEDTVQGFAFVDLSHKRFDVVLMNPPFGNPSKNSRKYLSSTYPKLWADMYASFMSRAIDLLLEGGRLGAITSRTFFALPSFEPLRALLLSQLQLLHAVECGLGVLDNATVRAAFTIAEKKSFTGVKLLFIDLRQFADRDQALLEALRWRRPDCVYQVEPSEFNAIPSKPFCYWLPRHFRKMLATGPHLDEARLKDSPISISRVTVGASTTADDRFVRCHWEVHPQLISREGWARFAHAIGFCRYYAPTYTVVKWFGNGNEILSLVDANGNTKARLRCPEHFFKNGMVSPYISELGLGCSFLPAEHILSNSCRGYFDSTLNEAALVGYMNSSFVDVLIWALTPDRKHEAGIIASVPVPDLKSEENTLQELVHKSWRCVRAIRTRDEADPLYCGPSPRPEEDLASLCAEAASLQQAIDSAVARLVGLTDESAAALLTLAAAPHVFGKWETADREDSGESDNEQEDELESSRSNENVPPLSGFSSQLSFAMGCAFGRWDIRRCDHIDIDALFPNPQVPFPQVQPAAFELDNGRSCLTTPPDYPLRINWDGILVDDAEHHDDVLRRAIEILEMVWPGRAEVIEKEACEALAIKDLREYFRRAGKGGFWDDHLSRYSKSRRKAPVYWLLQSSKRNYGIWLYYHRLDKDVLFKALVNYVEPRIRLQSSRLEGLRKELPLASGMAKQGKRLAKEIAQQEDFLSELQDFEEKLRKAANLHLTPDLNDGVVLNIAPLYALIPWKEAETRWNELLEGKYEWSSIGKQLRQKGLVR
jgi:hypothetical protein